MNIKALFISSIFSITSFSTYALDIELANGISIEALNGEQYKEDNLSNIEGENQFVFRFKGELKDSSKRKKYSSRPYIVTLDLKEVKTLEVGLISSRYRVIERNVNKEAPIFVFKIDGQVVSDKQEMLPPLRSILPYMDIPQLVREYNMSHGLTFDSGRVIELKEELAKIKQEKTASDTVVNPPVKLAGVNETENTLELKLWYLKASKEERKLFKRWMIEQD